MFNRQTEISIAYMYVCMYVQHYKWKQVYRRWYESRHSSKPKLHYKQRNKIWRRTIFNMADGILTPCNVARWWHWFHQVTAPCNVACGSGIVIVNSASGSTLQCDTWLWDDMPLNSPGSSTLQCGSRMTCDWIRPNVHHIGILHLVSISTTCHSAPVSEILSKSNHPR